MLIRHGHTTSNGGDQARLSGVSDVPLSELGRREAASLATHLRARGERFAAILSSPLVRARDTARPLCEAGLGPLSIDEGLKEIDCGEYDGRLLHEVERAIPDHWARNARQDDPDFRWPGGESYREFRARCIGTIRRIVGAHAGERVAVVTHAGFISQLLGYVARLSEARWGTYRPGNTAVSELVWSETAARLLRFDDRAHLDSEPYCAIAAQLQDASARRSTRSAS